MRTSQGLRASVRVNAAAVTWEDVEGVRPPRHGEAGTTSPSPRVAGESRKGGVSAFVFFRGDDFSVSWFLVVDIVHLKMGA